MTAAIAAEDVTDTRRRPSSLRPLAILLLGVVVIPIALSAAFNSYGALTEESAVRMAFATVAGQVFAILSAAVMVGIAVKRRRHPVEILVLSVVAVLVVVYAIAVCGNAGDLLLSRLDLIAEVDLLNR